MTGLHRNTFAFDAAYFDILSNHEHYLRIDKKGREAAHGACAIAQWAIRD